MGVEPVAAHASHAADRWRERLSLLDMIPD